jgi:DNA-binding transcriptional LysR family regulator
LTLQQLEYFLGAARHGSFSAAAEELHLAQPSLSEQVRRLEAELGVTLFARLGRGVALTEAGKALRPYAEETIAAAAAARESVVAVRELRGGIATFGAWGTARYYGTDIVAEFCRRHPEVRVRFVGQNSSEVVQGVHDGDLEVGMVALPIDDRGLEVEPIMRDEIVYVSADPARLRRPMSIARLAGAPLILSDASYGHEDPTRRHLAALAQRVGVRIEPRIDVEHVEAALMLAARGLGDTLVARGILLALGRRLPRRLGWVPFDEPIYDTFAFVARRGAPLSPASREFRRLARERLEQFAARLETTPPRRRDAGG